MTIYTLGDAIAVIAGAIGYAAISGGGIILTAVMSLSLIVGGVKLFRSHITDQSQGSLRKRYVWATIMLFFYIVAFIFCAILSLINLKYALPVFDYAKSEIGRGVSAIQGGVPWRF